MDDVLKLVEEAGLDKEKFVQDFDNQAARDEISNELTKSQELELDSTPTMIIDGEKIVGVKPYFELKGIVD